MLLLIDWYFCIVPPLRQGIKKKKKRGPPINYPNSSSAIRQVPRTEDLPVPVPPQQYILDLDDDSTENWDKTPQPSTSVNPDFTLALQFNEFHRITEDELNDLIRDLDLPKSKAELVNFTVSPCILIH